jgi:hypothetical protein
MKKYFAFSLILTGVALCALLFSAQPAKAGVCSQKKAEKCADQSAKTVGYELAAERLTIQFFSF